MNSSSLLRHFLRRIRPSLIWTSRSFQMQGIFLTGKIQTGQQEEIADFFQTNRLELKEQERLRPLATRTMSRLNTITPARRQFMDFEYTSQDVRVDRPTTTLRLTDNETLPKLPGVH